MYHIFFSHASADGHLGCSHVLAIVNSAAVNIWFRVSFWFWFSLFLILVCPVVWLLVILFWVFKDPPYCSVLWLYQLIFIPTVWIYILAPTVQERSLFSIPSLAFIVCRFFIGGYSDGCEVILYGSFDYHFTNN